MTIAFYVNWNVFGNNVKVMDFGQDDGTNNIRIGNVGTSNTMEVAIHSAGNVKSFRYDNVFQIEKWVQVIVLFDATSNQIVYVNGYLQVGTAVLAQHNDPIPTASRIGSYLGKSSHGTDDYFSGLMDEFFLYSRQLNDKEMNCMFDICTKYSCDQCEHDDQTCRTCAAPRIIPPHCICLEGQFENENFECQSCEYPCRTCKSLTHCLTCHDEVNRYDPPGCHCNEVSWENVDKCDLLAEITFTIVSSDRNKIFYNYDGHDAYNITIEFSIDFTLPSGTKDLTNYLEISISENEAKAFSYNITQSDQNELQYIIQIDIYKTIRHKIITVDFKDHDNFTDYLGNHLENRFRRTYLKDFFFYTDEQRDESDFYALITKFLVYICLVPGIPMILLDRGWKMAIAFDPLQFIYLLSFINIRLPVNAKRVNESIDIFRSFNFPNLFWHKDNGNIKDYKFVYVDVEFIKNIEPILYVYGTFLLSHVALRLIYCALSQIRFRKAKDFIRYILHNIFEYRYHIDYWQMVMSILATFAYIKYKNFDDSYSAFFAMCVGLLLFGSPYFSIYQLYNWRNKAKEIPRNEIGQLMFPYNEFGDQKGFAFKNLWQFINVEKKGAIYFMFFFLGRKLLATFIFISLQQSLSFQINCLQGMNFAYALLIIIRRPFKDQSDNVRVTISEIFVQAELYLIYTLQTDDSEDENKRYDFTWYLLYIYIVQLIYQGFYSLYELVVSIRLRLKKNVTPFPVFEEDYYEAQAKKKMRKQNVRVLDFGSQEDESTAGSQKQFMTSSYKTDNKISIYEENRPKKKTILDSEAEFNKKQFEMQESAYKQNKEVDKLLKTTTSNQGRQKTGVFNGRSRGATRNQNNSRHGTHIESQTDIFASPNNDDFETPLNSSKNIQGNTSTAFNNGFSKNRMDDDNEVQSAISKKTPNAKRNKNRKTTKSKFKLGGGQDTSNNSPAVDTSNNFDQNAFF